MSNKDHSLKNNSKIKTWFPPKMLFPPFELISLVNYPPFCGEVDFHKHDLFQELMIVSGRFDLNDPQGNRMRVNEGEILIIPSGKPHAWRIGATGCRALQINHAPMLLENFGKLSILFGNVKADWQKVNIGRNAAGGILKRLEFEFKSARPADSVFVFAYLLECFAMILRRYSRDKHSPADANLGDTPIKRALDCILNHYREKMTLKMLAQTAHLSPSRFSEIFRRNTGCAPIQYMNKYRLEKARLVLAYSEMPIKQVADYFGFKSIHYFSRAFKKQFGRSPSERSFLSIQQ